MKKDKLDIKWIEKELEGWKELQESTEMTIMMKEINKRLERAKEGRETGQGREKRQASGMILQSSRTGG